jgi:hypothetical protein
MQCRMIRLVAALALGCGMLMSAASAAITYRLTPLGGNAYAYSYTIGNDTGMPVDELTLYFDRLLYANLHLDAAPAGWDPLLLQPDLALPADGFLDLLTLGPPLPHGGSLDGLSVSFSYLGQGQPGAQPFDVVDPETFAVLFAGRTVGMQAPHDIPAPAPLPLLMLGLGVLAAGPARRRLTAYLR